MMNRSPIADFQPRGLPFEEINKILAVPRFKRGDMIRNTVPPIDMNTVDNWLRRGLLDLDRHAAAGNQNDLRKAAAAIKANEKIGPHRRYTGSNILAVMTLHAISQIGLPFKVAPAVIDAVLEHAVMILQYPHRQGVAVFVVTTDATGDYELRRVRRDHLASFEASWFAVIDVDHIIGQFLASGAGRKTAPDPLDDAERGKDD